MIDAVENTPELIGLHLGVTDEDSSEEPGEDPSSASEGRGEDGEDTDADPDELGIGALVSGDVDEWDESEDVDDFLPESWEDDPSEVETETVDSLTQRDQRAASYDGDAPHGEIRDYLRETGLATDVQDALAEVGTEEHDEPAPRGSVLDLKNAIRRVAGDTTVDELYRQRTERPGDDVAVGVSVDMSGSMSTAELEAKAAIGAFLFGVQEFGGDVVSNAWQREGEILHLTGAYERFEWRHLDAVEPGGADPIARGMFECARLLRRTRASEKLLVVITDGKPTVVSRDEGAYNSAVEEASDTVAELRATGLSVVGFGFGSVKEQNLESMFGVDGYQHVELEDLADGLVDFFAEQMDQSPSAAV